MFRSGKRTEIVSALAMAFLISSTIATDGFAQRGSGGGGRGGSGLSVEERAFLDSLSREERREIRSMDRSEKRTYIRKRMGRRPEGSADAVRDSNNGANENPAQSFAGVDGFVPPGKIAEDVRLMVGKMRGRDKAAAVAIQKARGGIETGLEPAFIGGAACPEIDSEKWAIDYSHKRP